MVNNIDNILYTDDVSAEGEALEHVHLCSLNLIISILLVPQPVLIKPIINFCFSIDWVAKVGGTG